MEAKTRVQYFLQQQLLQPCIQIKLISLRLKKELLMMEINQISNDLDLVTSNKISKWWVVILNLWFRIQSYNCIWGIYRTINKIKKRIIILWSVRTSSGKQLKTIRVWTKLQSISTPYKLQAISHKLISELILWASQIQFKIPIKKWQWTKRSSKFKQMAMPYQKYWTTQW